MGTKCDCKTDWLWVRSPLEGIRSIYLRLYFHFFALVSRQSAAFSFRTPPEFGREWGTECINTSFSLPTLLCTGYSVQLIFKLTNIYFSLETQSQCFTMNQINMKDRVFPLYYISMYVRHSRCNTSYLIRRSNKKLQWSIDRAGLMRLSPAGASVSVRARARVFLF